MNAIGLAIPLALAVTVPVLGEPPVLVSSTPPGYPEDAQRRCIEGYVTITVSVTPEGMVGDLEIAELVGPESFAESAKAAIGTWEFKPASISGEPVSAMVSQTIHYELADERKTACAGDAQSMLLYPSWFEPFFPLESDS